MQRFDYVCLMRTLLLNRMGGRVGSTDDTAEEIPRGTDDNGKLFCTNKLAHVKACGPLFRFWQNGPPNSPHSSPFLTFLHLVPHWLRVEKIGGRLEYGV